MLVITGATGNIGSKVADILLTKGEKVRVVGRNAARLQRFVDRGAEAAVGDLKNSAFLARAFDGAAAAFVMIPPDYTAKNFRVYQNEVGAGIAAAIKNSGIRHVVNLSSQGAELAAGTGPIKGLHDQEERLNQIEGITILNLRPTYFMENLLMNIPLIKTMNMAGSAVRGDLSFAMIATADIAAYAAQRLVTRDGAGKSVADLLGQRDLSLKEATTIIGRKIDKPDLNYVQFSYEDAAKGMLGMGLSEDVCREFIEMSRAQNDGLFGVNRPRTPENTTATSMEEFARTFAQIYFSK